MPLTTHLMATRTRPGKGSGKTKTMMWTPIVIVVAVLLLLLLLKRRGRVSTKTAVQYLRNGAVLIDVRSAGEFTVRHLPRAVNIPLSEIETVIGRKVKDKNQVVLLHCQSGRRALEARRRLKAVGYAKAFNLGSYDRATQIVTGR